MYLRLCNNKLFSPTIRFRYRYDNLYYLHVVIYLMVYMKERLKSELV